MHMAVDWGTLLLLKHFHHCKKFLGRQAMGKALSSLQTQTPLSPPLSLHHKPSCWVDRLAKRAFVPNLYSGGTHQLAQLQKH